MKRTEAREQAFLLLFEAGFKPNTTADTLINLKYNQDDSNDDSNCDDYTVELVNGVIGQIDEIDQIINTYSTKWKINRLSRVTAAAMRISVYEIKNSEQQNSEAVFINEAVELIKKYDGIESAKYANGVLGAYVDSRK